MAIGEFGGAAKTPSEGGLLMSAPLYWFYEMSQAALNPSRAFADAARLMFKNPLRSLATLRANPCMVTHLRTPTPIEAILRS